MIRLKNLQKDYKDFKLDVTMEVPAGRVTGIIGKNGAGKTTTIKAILGLIRTDGGEIEVFGNSKVTETAKQFEIPHTARIPIDPAFAAMVDAGEVESISCDALSEIADAVEKIEVAE